jgi:hypothetical protein
LGWIDSRPWTHTILLRPDAGVVPADKPAKSVEWGSAEEKTIELEQARATLDILLRGTGISAEATG